MKPSWLTSLLIRISLDGALTSGAVEDASTPLEVDDVRVLQATVVFNFPAHVLQVLGDVVALNELNSLRTWVVLSGSLTRCLGLHAMPIPRQASLYLLQRNCGPDHWSGSCHKADMSETAWRTTSLSSCLSLAS